MNSEAELDEAAIGRWLERHMTALESYVMEALENTGTPIVPAAADDH